MRNDRFQHRSRDITVFVGSRHTILGVRGLPLSSSFVQHVRRNLHLEVGVLRRVCVVLDEEDQLIELVNPEIIYTEGEQTGLEGCLSVPGKYGVVTRPEVVRVRAQDRDGQWFEVEDEGLTARCFCHEIEHLDGHLFVEHTDRLMEGEELQKWLEAHADEYEIEEEEDK